MIPALATAVALAVLLAWTLVAGRKRVRSMSLRLESAQSDLERLQKAFARFAPAPLVDRIVDAGTDLRGEKRTVTVLFTDIQGFTSLSETLQPSVLLHVLSGYFTAMAAVVVEHHGQVTRYIGDAMMALFGALDSNPWQVRDAVLAGLGMREALVTYNLKLAAQRLPPVSIGIGIHSGPVVAGVIGAEDLLQFDVYGDVVNVASRVQGLTRTFETDLLITDVVQQLLGDQFATTAMPPTIVKGKSAAIQTYAVQGVGKTQVPPAPLKLR